MFFLGLIIGLSVGGGLALVIVVIIVVAIMLLQGKYIFYLFFMFTCSGESIAVWLFLGYVTRHLMSVG